MEQWCFRERLVSQEVTCEAWGQRECGMYHDTDPALQELAVGCCERQSVNRDLLGQNVENRGRLA